MITWTDTQPTGRNQAVSWCMSAESSSPPQPKAQPKHVRTDAALGEMTKIQFPMLIKGGIFKRNEATIGKRLYVFHDVFCGLRNTKTLLSSVDMLFRSNGILVWEFHILTIHHVYPGHWEELCPKLGAETSQQSLNI